MTADACEPGEPLHNPDGVFVRPMFQVIEDSFSGTLDSARWPVPHARDDLDGEA